MGIGVENLNVISHRQNAYTGDNDWSFNRHFGDISVDTTSPLFSLANLQTMIASAKDWQQSQATFDGVCAGIGNGVGTWYAAQSSDAKAGLRANLAHFP